MISPVRQAAVLALLVLACCGGGNKEGARQTVERGLTVAVAATDTARVAFDAWDRERQMTIAATATSREDGEAKLAAYRARRDRVLVAFQVAVSAIDAAVLAYKLAEEDEDKLTSAAVLASRALDAVLAVRSAIAALQGG